MHIKMSDFGEKAADDGRVMATTDEELKGGHSIECTTHAGHWIAFLHFVTLRP